MQLSKLVAFSVVVGIYLALTVNAYALEKELNIFSGHSFSLEVSEEIATIAIGNPNIATVTTVNSNHLLINANSSGNTSLTIFGRDGSLTQYIVNVTNDVSQLRSLIQQMEDKVTVDDVAGIIVLRGSVPTPAALARVLSLADRFTNSKVAEPNFSVISDKGGVLSGNLDEKVEVLPPELNLSAQRLNVNGGQGGQGGQNSQGGQGRQGGGAAAALYQDLMASKGNLAQNISRGNVIMVGQGKVMSLIKVKDQPKVEIQMRIVAVDRDKTDSLGIDWRLDGSKVSVGSLTGRVVSPLPSALDPAAGSGSGIINTGDANLFGFFLPGDYGISAFLRAIEQKGAARMLSEPLLTAVSGESASFLVGGSLPIPVQTLTAGNATQNAIAITNVQFIEFGLRLVVRPTVLENGDISIVLDQSISQPDYSNQIQILGAPIPSFTQRTISTLTESASGETWAVAGLLSEEDTRNLRAVPWISKVPILGFLFRSKENVSSRTELMITVTARTIKDANTTTTSFDDHGGFAMPARLKASTPPIQQSHLPPTKRANATVPATPNRSPAIMNFETPAD